MKVNSIIVITYLLIYTYNCKQTTTGYSVNDDKNAHSEDLDSLEFIKAPDSIMYSYLNNNYQEIGQIEWFSNKELGLDSCGWNMKYNDGSYFYSSECQEWGKVITIYFANKSIEDLKQMITTRFLAKGYLWYENEYRPNQFYEKVWTFKILRKEDKAVLELSYSWI